MIVTRFSSHWVRRGGVLGLVVWNGFGITDDREDLMYQVRECFGRTGGGLSRGEAQVMVGIFSWGWLKNPVDCFPFWWVDGMG